MWIKDLDGDLVNLSHCHSIVMTELENPVHSESHAVIARRTVLNTEVDSWLTIGDEDHCQRYLETTAKELG